MVFLSRKDFLDAMVDAFFIGGRFSGIFSCFGTLASDEPLEVETDTGGGGVVVVLMINAAADCSAKICWR